MVLLMQVPASVSASSVWTGTWSSEFGLGTTGFQNYGRCTLVQSGDVVTGTSYFKSEDYPDASGVGTYGWETEGSIEGTASGNRLTGVWQLVITGFENSVAVRTSETVADFVFVMSNDGTEFVGDINGKVVSDTQNSDIGDTFEYEMDYVLESTQPTSEPSLQVFIETDRLSYFANANEEFAWTITVTDKDSGGPVPDVILRATITTNLGTTITRDDKTNELGVSKFPFFWRDQDAGTWNIEVVASKPGYQDGHGTGTVTVLAEEWGRPSTLGQAIPLIVVGTVVVVSTAVVLGAAAFAGTAIILSGASLEVAVTLYGLPVIGTAIRGVAALLVMFHQTGVPTIKAAWDSVSRNYEAIKDYLAILTLVRHSSVPMQQNYRPISDFPKGYVGMQQHNRQFLQE